MRSRAAIIVTGTEVLTGRVADRNGPWLAEQLRVDGVDVSYILVVGDRADDLRTALPFARESDLIVTSGGLGPTADDLTAEIVGEVQGRPLRVDVALEQRIAAIVERLSAGRGWRLDPDATAASNRKQALVPLGASVLEPVGTAPGLVVPIADGRVGPPVVVLPGPPSELQAMWPAALADPAVQRALAQRAEVRQRTLRLWGTPSCCCLAEFAYATNPPSTYAEEPGRSVSRPESRPAVHDSATAMVRPRRSSSSATMSSMVRLSGENSVSG